MGTPIISHQGDFAFMFAYLQDLIGSSGELLNQLIKKYNFIKSLIITPSHQLFVICKQFDAPEKRYLNTFFTRDFLVGRSQCGV